MEHALLADLKRVTGKAHLFCQLAEAALEEPDGRVRDVLFPVVSEQTLRDLVREHRATGLSYRRHVHTAMRNSYRPTTDGCCPRSCKRSLSAPTTPSIDQ